jgi:hypothetical protein
MWSSSTTSAFTGMSRLRENRKSGTRELLNRFPIYGSPGKAKAGEDTAGVVSFQADGPNRTQVNLELFYDPKGFVESAGDSIGVVSRRVENDLDHFKEFIENPPP